MMKNKDMHIPVRHVIHATLPVISGLFGNKRSIVLAFLMGALVTAFGQQDTISEQGTISYISTANVYVRFVSTDLIETGDTLFRLDSGRLIGVLVVRNKSSISCVCEPVGDEVFQLYEKVLFFKLEPIFPVA
ncbi:MAG: hypothetical protein R3330_10795, partial [Saprospiraceae bacterium]|nr:hypothetical protein [Saprospiraceae bacterium]